MSAPTSYQPTQYGSSQSVGPTTANQPGAVYQQQVHPLSSPQHYSVAPPNYAAPSRLTPGQPPMQTPPSNVAYPQSAPGSFAAPQPGIPPPRPSKHSVTPGSIPQAQGQQAAVLTNQQPAPVLTNQSQVSTNANPYSRSGGRTSSQYQPNYGFNSGSNKRPVHPPPSTQANYGGHAQPQGSFQSQPMQQVNSIPAQPIQPAPQSYTNFQSQPLPQSASYQTQAAVQQRQVNPNATKDALRYAMTAQQCGEATLTELSRQAGCPSPFL